jgi:hypothetical protein
MGKYKRLDSWLTPAQIKERRSMQRAGLNKLADVNRLFAIIKHLGKPIGMKGEKAWQVSAPAKALKGIDLKRCVIMSADHSEDGEPMISYVAVEF